MANYINTDTMAYPVMESQIRAEYPNTSFPKPFVAPAPYAPVLNSPQPEYNQITQAVVETQPQLIQNNWMQQWEVIDLDPEQIAYNEEQAKQNNKSTAESLLQQTDWTATVDISDPQYSDPYLVNQAEFLAYRSAVRQIAVNPPVTVVQWPTKPEEIWSA
jgi:hypothetical protein